MAVATEAKKTVEDRSKFLENFLRRKEADNPCPRCGNNRFYVPEENLGPFFVTYCSNCGFKSEYLVSILIDMEAEE